MKMDNTSNENMRGRSFFMRLIFFVFISILILIFENKISTKISNYAYIVVNPLYKVVDYTNFFLNWTSELLLPKNDLLGDYKKLKEEIFFLRSRQLQFDGLLFENKRLKQLLNYSYQISDYNPQLAFIVKINQTRFKKQFVINKGKEDGVYKGQTVISKKGIIGHVIDVEKNNSKVMFLTDPLHIIPVKSLRNGIRGIIKGLSTIDNTLKLQFVNKQKDIVVGDIFVTNKLGNKFPPNYYVGKVIKIFKPEYDIFMEVELKALEDIDNLDFVILISKKK